MYNKKLKDGCYFVPLGGCDEIGRNLNAFGIVTEGQEQWILIDVGVSIEKNFGINLQIPLFDFVLNKNLIGIVCTHGHDDHIGALPFVVPILDEQYKKRNNGKSIPIFATKFTMGLIKKKFEENGELGNFVTIPVGNVFSIGNFQIEMIYITHSIPEPNMVKVVMNPFNYTFVHTGDWKLDSDPIVGEVTNEDYIRKIGQGGIDLLICDSTNAMEENHTPPEGLVKESLDKIIKGNTGRRIIVSCFASNVARVKIVYDLAKKYNRKVVLFGRSLLKICDIAIETGHLDKNIELYKASDVHNLDINQTIVVCTGSQGEKGSILHRLAYGNKPPFNLRSKDLIIFSSRKIPGNEREIADMQSIFIRKGCEIIDSRMADIHVSGHPSQPEIKKMIELIKPKSFIPVHGQALNFVYMSKIAKEMQVPKILIPFNGAIIDLLKTEIIDKTEVGLIGVDGYQMINMNSQMINTRKTLAANGAVFISVIPGKKPVMCSYGVLPENNYDNFLYDISKIVLNIMKKYKSNDRKESVNLIINEVNGFIRHNFNKNPLISVHIMNDNNVLD